MALQNDEEKRHVGDAQLGELEHERALAQGGDKAYKAHHIQTVADEAVVHDDVDSDDVGEVGEEIVGEEVLDDVSTLKIEDGGQQEPPVEQSRVLQLLRLRVEQRDANALLEHQDLDHQHTQHSPELS